MIMVCRRRSWPANATGCWISAGTCVHPLGGAGWLDERGEPDLARPGLHLDHRPDGPRVLRWSPARRPGRPRVGRAGVGRADRAAPRREAGGWFTSVDADGTVPDEKACYTHAFVVLAASSAVVADIPGARELLDEALEVWTSRFFDAEAEMFADAWNRDFTELSPYRGVNGNMHAVEALLAAADVLEIKLCGIAPSASPAGRRPSSPSRSTGESPNTSTPSGGRCSTTTGMSGRPVPAVRGDGRSRPRVVPAAAAPGGGARPTGAGVAAAVRDRLFDRAVADGWAVDGADGFVYTTDWDGRPVVRDRMHWVVAEAIAAAAALHARTGERRFADLAGVWWAYAEEYLFDRELGSWHHQLDAQNRVIGTVWPGKPDLYHAVQATVIPRLPLAPSMATALGVG